MIMHVGEWYKRVREGGKSAKSDLARSRMQVKARVDATDTRADATDARVDATRIRANANTPGADATDPGWMQRADAGGGNGKCVLSKSKSTNEKAGFAAGGRLLKDPP